MEIYLITNNLNGKQYVGLTTRTSEERFREHLKGDSYIDRAIRKYGKENFSLEVLCRPRTIDSLKKQEDYWATKLNTYYPNGYNIAKCGSAGCGIDREEAYYLNSERSFKEFVDFCFDNRYSLTANAKPIKVWEPDKSIFVYEKDDDMFDCPKLIVSDDMYNSKDGNIEYYRSINMIPKLGFDSKYGTIFPSKWVISQSISNKKPVIVEENNLFYNCEIKPDIYICASYISQEEYSEYIYIYINIEMKLLSTT